MVNYYKQTAMLIGKFIAAGIGVLFILLFLSMIAMIPFGGPVFAGWLFATGITKFRDKHKDLMEARIGDIFWILLSLGMILVFIISIIEYVFVIAALSFFSAIINSVTAYFVAGNDPGDPLAIGALMGFVNTFFMVLILYVVIQLSILIMMGLFFTNRKYKKGGIIRAFGY